MRRLFYSDDDFGGMFRDKLNQHQVQPSEGLWSKIDSRLNGTTHSGNKNRAIWCSAGLVLVTILLLLTYNMVSPVVEENDALSSIESQTNNSTIPIIAHTNTESDNTRTEEQGFVNSESIKASSSLTLRGSINLLQLEQTLDDVLLNLKNTIRTDTQLTPLTVQLRYFNQAVNIPPIDAVIAHGLFSNNVTDNEVDQPLLNNSGLEESCSNGTYGQFNFGFGNYWMLTNSFQKNPNMNALFSPAYTISVGGGCIINKSLALEIALSGLQSKINYESVNQNKRMQSTTKIRSDISLSFVQVPVSIKFNITRDCNRSLELQAGYVFSKLVSASTFLGGNEYPFASDEIKQQQHAVLLGVESGAGLSNKLSLRYGLRASCNTSMLATMESERLNDLYRPVPLVVSAHIGLQLHK